MIHKLQYASVSFILFYYLRKWISVLQLCSHWTVLVVEVKALRFHMNDLWYKRICILMDS